MVKKGYEEKRRWVYLRGHSQALEKVVVVLVSLGYRKGMRYVSESALLKRQEGYRRRVPGTVGRGARGRGHRSTRRMVELGYSKEGTPRMLEFQLLSKPSRPRTVTHKERWGRSTAGFATVLVETPSGRKTREEARQGELGGMLLVMVR